MRGWVSLVNSQSRMGSGCLDRMAPLHRRCSCSRLSFSLSYQLESFLWVILSWAWADGWVVVIRQSIQTD